MKVENKYSPKFSPKCRAIWRPKPAKSNQPSVRWPKFFAPIKEKRRRSRLISSLRGGAVIGARCSLPSSGEHTCVTGRDGASYLYAARDVTPDCAEAKSRDTPRVSSERMLPHERPWVERASIFFPLSPSVAFPLSPRRTGEYFVLFLSF